MASLARSPSPADTAGPSRQLVVGVAVLAVAIFVPLFVTHGVGAFDFWWWMTANNLLVLAVVAWRDPGYLATLRQDLRTDLWKKVGIGLGSAVLLYFVFFVGNIVAHAIIPGAGAGVNAIYGFKEGASVVRIAVLMGTVFGPGEELFWRGFLQRGAARYLGAWKGYAVSTAVYSLVHVGSGNFMLVLAAAVCGLFWGLLYVWKRSMVVNVLSHTSWDLTVFLILPYG
jgi:membrane protease YdiL (CAAX protease family)